MSVKVTSEKKELGSILKCQCRNKSPTCADCSALDIVCSWLDVVCIRSLWLKSDLSIYLVKWELLTWQHIHCLGCGWGRSRTKPLCKSVRWELLPDNTSTVLDVVEIGQRPKLYANYLSLNSDPETGQGPLSIINFLPVRLS